MLRIGIATAAASLLALTAGCSWFEGGEEDLDFAAYEGRLTDMYNESVRLNAELDEAEARILRDCLEAQGFTLHDPDALPSPAESEQESFLAAPPYQHFLPTVEEAERGGFWHWGGLDGAADIEDQELYAEYQEQFLASLPEAFREETGAMLFSEEGAELHEFFYLPAEDQYDWYVAYGGEGWAAYHHAELDGRSGKTDASGGEVAANPRPGGCLLDMVEAVYGELRSVPNEEEGWNDWVSRPEPPNGDWEALDERYAEGTADAEGDLLDCLADRGSEGWEFDDQHLQVREYLVAAGETTNPADAGTATTGPWPEIPDDAPDAADVEGWIAFERDLAVDFAECGDESGYRETADHAWEQAQLRYHLDIEDETYAWQEEMRGYLENAQEVIGG